MTRTSPFSIQHVAPITTRLYAIMIAIAHVAIALGLLARCRLEGLMCVACARSRAFLQKSIRAANRRMISIFSVKRNAKRLIDGGAPYGHDGLRVVRSRTKRS
jgi:hypothetical protein